MAGNPKPTTAEEAEAYLRGNADVSLEVRARIVAALADERKSPNFRALFAGDDPKVWVAYLTAYAAAGAPKRSRDEEEYLELSVPSASEFSKDNKQAAKWQRQDMWKGKPEDFLDGRPLCANGRCHRKRCPAALVHPAVAQALEDLSCPAQDLTPEDWALYYEVAELVTFYHLKEETLRKQLLTALNKARPRGLNLICQSGDIDGVLQAMAWVLLLGIKPMQGSAELELAVHYRQSLREARQVGQHMSLLPCATLEAVGNELRLGVLWYEDTACAARLACVELRRDSGLEERRAGAALLRACMNLTVSLAAWYQCLLGGSGAAPTLAPPPAAPDMFREGLPHALAFDARWQDVAKFIQYRLYAADDAHHSNRPVALKMGEHFRPEAHAYWAARGLAVGLLEAPLPLGGGFSLLVMPLLRPEDGWLAFHRLPAGMQAACRERVVKLFSDAHEPDPSGRRFVHGDARRCNVMAHVSISAGALASNSCARPATALKEALAASPDTRPDQLLLNDTDWSGEAGVDKYLVRPNPSLGMGASRPDAVVCGAVLQQEHDLDTISACFKTVDFDNILNRGMGHEQAHGGAEPEQA